MKHRKAFLKEERQTQIINRYVATYKGNWSAFMTAADVGRWLDISPTQARNLLKGLVRQEVLYTVTEDYPGICGYRNLYKFTREYVEACNDKRFRAEPKPKRYIKINGQQIEIGGLK